MISYSHGRVFTAYSINNNFSKNICSQNRLVLRSLLLLGAAICALVLSVVQCYAQTDPLPSWNDGPCKAGYHSVRAGHN